MEEERQSLTARANTYDQVITLAAANQSHQHLPDQLHGDRSHLDKEKDRGNCKHAGP